VAVRIQQAEVAVQLAAVIPSELRANTVQGDVQRSPIRLQVDIYSWYSID